MIDAQTSPSASRFRRPPWPVEVVLVLLFVAGTVLAAAALAGPVDRLLQDLGWLDAAPGESTRQFLKVFRRLLLIPLVVGFLIAVRPWRDGSLQSYGLTLRGADLRSGARAWLATVAIATALLAGHFLAGWLTWEDPLKWSKGLGRIVRWIPTGVVIAALEAWFFRGWLLRRTRRFVGAPLAVLLTSLVFGLLHVFNVRRVRAEVTHVTAGALDALGQWMDALVDPFAFGPALVGLTLLALVLTAAYLRTGTLWTSIGIHAAGVFVLKAYGGFTDRFPSWTWAGGKWLYDGPLGWAILLTAFLLLWPWGKDVDPVIRGDRRT